jgi:hypothetical protein
VQHELSPVGKIASKGFLDRLGMWISTACAVHCALLPLLITVAGLGWLGDERVEWTIIGLSFLIATFRLFHSYFFEHRRNDSVLLFLVGAVSILLAKSEILEFRYAEPVFMTIGGLMIAAAHWRNHHLVSCCQPAAISR